MSLWQFIVTMWYWRWECSGPEVRWHARYLGNQGPNWEHAYFYYIIFYSIAYVKNEYDSHFLIILPPSPPPSAPILGDLEMLSVTTGFGWHLSLWYPRKQTTACTDFDIWPRRCTSASVLRRLLTVFHKSAAMASFPLQAGKCTEV